MPTLDIYCGDAAHKLVNVATESVQLVVTSPPYDDARTYGGSQTPEWDFKAIAAELHRVLVPGGVICWNVNDMVVNGSETLTSFRQAIHFKDALGFRIHDTMVWHKPNFSNPEKVRYHQLFEYIFILSKGAPRCFNPIKDKPNKYPNGPWGKNTYRLPTGEMAERPFNPANEFGMRGNVWAGNTCGQERPKECANHPAMMPNWLARDLILSWSNPGDTVLDPFGGSGTTGQQANAHGRHAILIDRNPDYVAIMKQKRDAQIPELALA